MNSEQFSQLAAQGYNRIPVMREVLADLDTPLSSYLKLAAGPYSYLFESVQGGEKWGRYSMIGLPARTVLKAFGDATREAGASTKEGEGNWAKSTFEDLVQYNDGFKTNLIGTPQQIAERIVALKNIGVDLVLSGFLHFIEEVEYFGEKVLPLVRQLEQQQDIQLEEKSA